MFSNCKQTKVVSQPLDKTESKIDSLLSLMTLEEKVGQLVQVSFNSTLTGTAQSAKDSLIRSYLRQGRIGSLLNLVSAKQTREAQQMVLDNTRLRIPLLFGYDVIHGHQTMLPIPLAQSCSWDMEAIILSARVAAREASSQGINWTFAPMLDVGHDARWGRVMEGSGEDPYLTSRIAEANIIGFQGNDLSEKSTIAACAKHFAGYALAEGGRDYNTVDISQNTLHNLVLPPFKAAAEAGVATFMNSFNEIGGLPSTGNSYLLRELLKENWGFKGLVVSDWNSIGEMVYHGYAKNIKDASKKALIAGSDVDMMTYGYLNHLKELVEEGQVSESMIDDAVRRVLRIKFELGLFDDPFKYCDEEREKTELGSEENLNSAYEVAKRSIVLLKNDGLLPLSNKIKKIGVIGQLASDKNSALGSWRASAKENSAISVLEGLSKVLPAGFEMGYARGVKVFDEANFHTYPKINETDRSGLEEAVLLAQQSDLLIMVLGENCFQSGESKNRAYIDLPGLQQEMLEEVYAVNKNIVVILMNGRPLELTWMDEYIPTILETWYAGSQAGNAIADILIGKYNPSGKLTMSFPRTTGQIPIYYNHKNTGRPYDPEWQDFMTEYKDESYYALYPFGHGLSYTSFEYTDLELSASKISSADSIRVSVNLTNTGEYDGEEVIQLYIRDLVASRTRPVKELKGFKKVFLRSGEKKRISFTLTEEDLEFYNGEAKWIAEAGEFKIMVGGSSVDLLEGSFELY